MRWKRVESTDVIDQRAGGGVPGGRVAIPGGMGITGIIVFLAIQLLSGGGGTAFGIDDPFGSGGSAHVRGRAVPTPRAPARVHLELSFYGDTQNRLGRKR